MVKKGFSDYIRPIITVAFVVMVGYGFYSDKITADYVMGLATAIFGWYFQDSSKKEYMSIPKD